MKDLTPAATLAVVERRIIELFDGLSQGLAGRLEVALTLLAISPPPTGQARLAI
jgi:hypothetical protein